MESLNIYDIPTIQCEIPHTNIKRYITEIYALNVQAPEGTSGDWHDVFYWHDGIEKPRIVTLAGEGMELDTNSIYDDYGIYEGKERLAEMGLDIHPNIKEVYIANHFRAILDMLYLSLMKCEAVYNLTGATDDWLDTPEQKAFLLSKAELLDGIFSDKAANALRKWIEREKGSA